LKLASAVNFFDSRKLKLAAAKRLERQMVFLPPIERRQSTNEIRDEFAKVAAYFSGRSANGFSRN
jgi:hypothetical protein